MHLYSIANRWGKARVERGKNFILRWTAIVVQRNLRRRKEVKKLEE